MTRHVVAEFVDGKDVIDLAFEELFPQLRKPITEHEWLGLPSPTSLSAARLIMETATVEPCACGENCHHWIFRAPTRSPGLGSPIEWNIPVSPKVSQDRTARVVVARLAFDRIVSLLEIDQLVYDGDLANA